ncbi:hypothetical protein CS542_04735 [Pedobacter sp. IW39]|nr:hypothetical protein CS542_04735 [Pedobacter sp. IW39]
MRSVLRKDDTNYADKPTFIRRSAISLLFGGGLDGINLEPKAVYRGIKNYKIYGCGCKRQFR